VRASFDGHDRENIVAVDLVGDQPRYLVVGTGGELVSSTFRRIEWAVVDPSAAPPR
jgi:hypothetical protein